MSHFLFYKLQVHGGIRHLEKKRLWRVERPVVHGGIRHLESEAAKVLKIGQVHGGIRHLEKSNS